MAAEDLLDRIEEELDRDDVRKALALARKAVRKHKQSPDAWSLLAECMERLGDLDGAVTSLARAVELDPAWAGGFARMGGLYLDLGQLGKASLCIERALDLDDSEPEACHSFAILCELEGETASAERFYAAAAELDPDRFSVPVRVTRSDFDAMARLALDDLPDRVREYVEDVPVSVSDFPSRDETGRFVNDAPLLLGECIGDHRETGGALDPETCTPARIVLYKANLERVCTSRDELAEQVRITVLHELLHWLGLDESEIDGRGLG